MSTAEVQFFSPPLLNNYFGLEKLMKGEEALSEIETLSKDEGFIKSPLPDGPYFNRWSVVWITIIHPCEAGLSLFFTALSKVAGLLYLQKVSRIFSVLSSQMLRDWDQLSSQRDIKSPMLIPAFNAHQTSSWDLYGLGSIPTDFITDELTFPMTAKSAEFASGVKQAMKVFYQALEKGREGWFSRGTQVSQSEKDACTKKFGELYEKSESEALDYLKSQYPEKGTPQAIAELYDLLNKADDYIAKNCGAVSLFSDTGLCRGAALWFISLYLQTKNKFEQPMKHLIAVAEQFKTGVPRQGALLQGFHDSDKLLKLKSTSLMQHRVFSYELDHDRQSALKKIETLPVGIHRVGVKDHSLVYIKVNQSEAFVWDPTFGLYAMSAQQMLDMVLKHLYKPSDPACHIYFDHYEHGG